MKTKIGMMEKKTTGQMTNGAKMMAGEKKRNGDPAPRQIPLMVQIPQLNFSSQNRVDRDCYE